VAREYRVGDKIVDFGRVYRIFKLEEEKLYFSPFFEDGRSRITCSIPKENIEKTNIRRPVRREKLEVVWEILATEIVEEEPLDADKAKKTLAANKVRGLARTIRRLWQEKQDEEINFNKRKQDLFQLTVSRLSEEVAVVKRVSLKRAGTLIDQALQGK